jgi:3-oxoacyl-[acyl-carrier-protein] synthase II
MRRVAITGMGLVSPHGMQPLAAFDAWCAGQSGIAPSVVGEDPYTLQVPLALCQDFDPSTHIARSRLTTMDRVSQLSAVAAQSAWLDAGLQDLPETQRDSVCVFWGTGAGGMHSTERTCRDLFVKNRSRVSPLSVVLSMNNAAAAQVALQLGLGGDCLTYSVACASSAIAVGEAFHRIRAGRAALVLAGGGEAATTFCTLKAWESLRVMAQSSCRPFHAERDGLVLGEGAAALVLEDWDHAQRRGAKIVAEVIGYGSSCDRSHLTQPDSAGQVRALAQALHSAGLNPSDIHYINAHGTATLDGDPAEINALKTILGDHAAKTRISSTKSMHGHLLGAAGALEILATALALQTQVMPPTLHLRHDQIDPSCAGLDHICGSAREHRGMQVALSNSFAFGGSNAVVALRRVER